MNLNLIERICDGFMSSSKEEILKGTCTKENFIRSCNIALGAFKLSSWADIDTDVALRLVTRYWDYAENHSAAGTPLTMDDSLNAMTLILLDEFPEHLLDMPEKAFFLLVTQTALGNMANVAEEYSARFNEEVVNNE